MILFWFSACRQLGKIKPMWHGFVVLSMLRSVPKLEGVCSSFETKQTQKVPLGFFFRIINEVLLLTKICPLFLCMYNENKVIEWLGLEGTSRIFKLQPPCHRQSCQSPHLILDQAAQGPIQPGLEHLQGWTGHPQPLWAAVPTPHHSHSKELPPDIQPKSSLLNLEPFPFVQTN